MYSRNTGIWEIIGFIGSNHGALILLDELSKIEYKGYDLFTIYGGSLMIVKTEC